MKKKRLVESWYEIEEYIGPNEARFNVPYWTPVCIGAGKNLQVYREETFATAYKRFKEIKPGRRMRIVKMTRKVLKEKE